MVLVLLLLLLLLFDDIIIVSLKICKNSDVSIGCSFFVGGAEGGPLLPLIASVGDEAEEDDDGGGELPGAVFCANPANEDPFPESTFCCLVVYILFGIGFGKEFPGAETFFIGFRVVEAEAKDADDDGDDDDADEPSG